MKRKIEVVRLPAIEIKQAPKRRLYAFSVDGKIIPDFATVSRIKRSDEGDLAGYQRPEQLAHIEEIRSYIESESPLLPNAIVIAFDKTVKFEPAPDAPHNAHARVGELLIPIDPTLPDHQKPGFIVDGQQRVAAIREAQVAHFPICATAFIASNIREQTEQFILVNSTKPLPKGLIHELLPSTDSMLPLQLERRRLPAVLVTRLNEDSRSPLFRAIKTATNPDGRIKDNSILKILENSLSDGALYAYRDDKGLDHDVDGMVKLVSDFFYAVRAVFPAEWELPPRRSRLTHGVGIAGLGFLMDSTAHRIGARKKPTRAQFQADLEAMRECFHWTDGSWNFGNGRTRRWDELQNTSKDIEVLVRYLGTEFKARVTDRERSKTRQLSLDGAS